MEKLSADALRLALVTASMEYYKQYVEGNKDLDNTKEIEDEISRLNAAGLGNTKNAQTLRDILTSKKIQSISNPELVNRVASQIKEAYPDALMTSSLF